MSRKLLASAVTAAATLAVAAPALADQVFHTSHAAVHPVANAPLRSGFVNDVHTNGAVNSGARGVPPERRAAQHDLPGAAPDLSDAELLRRAVPRRPDVVGDHEHRRQWQRGRDVPRRAAEQPAARRRNRLAVPGGRSADVRHRLRDRDRGLARSSARGRPACAARRRCCCCA